MQVHWFDDGEGWVVVAGDAVHRPATRSDAFAEARRLAQANAPSTLVRSAPDGWVPGTPATVPAAAEPPVVPGPAHDDGPPPLDDDFAPEGTDWAGPAPADDAGPGTGSAGAGAARRSTAPSERPAAAAGPRPRAPLDPGVLPDPSPPEPSGEPPDWVRLAGPDHLGRSVLVAPGADAPPPWADAERRTWTTDDPDLLAVARDAHHGRRRMVWEVPVDAVAPVDVLDGVAVWRLDPHLELEADALWWLMTANAVDARRPGAPWFPPTERAVAAGARRAGPGDPVGADVVLDDGVPACCDGGPLTLLGHERPPGLDPGVGVVHRVALERGLLVVDAPADPEADLAPDQLAAVAEPGACSRIVAPAGSGKTRVLTERARHLLADHHLPPGALCLVAFNKRAQREMAERTPDLPGLQVQTLNALALAVLNGGHGFVDRGERVRTIDEPDVRRLLDDLVSFPRRANTDPAAAWIDALSAVRLGLRDPAEVEAEFGGDVDGLPDVFVRYRDELRRAGAVDFDDQIYRAIEVLLAEPGTRARARSRCRLLLVDEFQDLTPAHLLLVRLLAGPELAVFGVGDDDQTIYGFSGATPEWLVGYDRFFPGATHHDLEVNYRCPAAVVGAAVNLLSHNAQRVPKTIRPGSSVVPDAAALEVERAAEPVAATVARVEALLADGAAPAEVAVLTRVNSLLAPVQVALVELGIPVAGTEGTRFLERTGVAAALSWLRLATGDGGFGGPDIQRAARRPGRSLSPRVIEWMAEQRDLGGLDRLAGRLTNERDADKVREFTADLERVCGAAVTRPTAELLELVRTEVGLDRTLASLDTSRRGRNTSAHADDLRALIALGRLHPDAASFPRWLRAALEVRSDPDGVTLATVHRVKGLEWPHVVVHDVTAGVLPHHLSTDVEEERRIFHVAMTRAGTSARVVADASAPSVFLDELDRPAPEPAPGRTADGADGRRRRAAAPAGGPGGGRSPATGPAEVPAVVDLELRWAGYDAVVTATGAVGATLRLGKASTEVAYGSTVEIDGRSVRLGPPAAPSRGRRGSGPVDAGDADPVVLEALKDWRRDRSRADAVPAYVVASDATLVEIATRKPTDLTGLGRVSGIGPAKLERYGDDILGIVDTAGGPAGA